MLLPSPGVRDESGVVLPTRLLALCISAVAMAALVYIANDPNAPRAPEATTAQNQPAATPTRTAEPTKATKPAKPKPKPIKRGKIYVEIFNNTHVTGLAGGVAEKAKAAGWNVVAADNWWGTFDGSAVYYPPKMRRAARELARDLGIPRVKGSEEPMKFDRLTVILTDDYS